MADAGKPPDFAAIIRAAIASSGKSQYAISKESGVPQQMINRLMNGKAASIETAGKLSFFLGLELVAATKKHRRKNGEK